MKFLRFSDFGEGKKYDFQLDPSEVAGSWSRYTALRREPWVPRDRARKHSGVSHMHVQSAFHQEGFWVRTATDCAAACPMVPSLRPVVPGLDGAWPGLLLGDSENLFKILKHQTSSEFYVLLLS